MGKARAYLEAPLCAECGQPIERGRWNQLLCRRCQQALERKRLKGRRQGRRGARRRREEEEDWY